MAAGDSASPCVRCRVRRKRRRDSGLQQRQRFAFLSWFDGIVVSGMEGVIKPHPRIFQILCERHRIVPETAVFIDDVAANAAAASALGIHGIHFRSPGQLRSELVALGMLPP